LLRREMFIHGFGNLDLTADEVFTQWGLTFEACTLPEPCANDYFPGMQRRSRPAAALRPGTPWAGKGHSRANPPMAPWPGTNTAGRQSAPGGNTARPPGRQT
jgi:hypothetical protein